MSKRKTEYDIHREEHDKYVLNECMTANEQLNKECFVEAKTILRCIKEGVYDDDYALSRIEAFVRKEKTSPKVVPVPVGCCFKCNFF